VISVWAGTEGKIDDVPVGDVRRFEAEFLQYLRHHWASTLDAIAGNDWDDDIVSQLDAAISEFKVSFLGKDAAIQVNELPEPAMAEGVEGQETVTVRHPRGR
jgi:F-type H+-transporting ATPase subunit alpha